MPTRYVEAGFATGANQGDYLVFDDVDRGLFDTGKLGPDEGLWTDITDDVRELSCSRGATRSDGVFSRTEAGQFAATLDNRSRDYDPTHATGPYYGQLLPRRPVRFRASYEVPSGVYVPDESSYVSTPDSAPLSITGDIDVRVRIKPDVASATVPMFGKWATTGNQQSWAFYHALGAFLFFEVSTTGSDSVSHFVVDTLTTTEPTWYRATRSATTGEIVLYRSADDTNVHDSVIWIELSRTTTTAGNIFNSTAATGLGLIEGIAIGGYTVYAGAVLDGIAGTAVADPCWHWDCPTMSTQTGATTWTDTPANVWTMGGSAAVAAPTTTFDVWRGYADGWPLVYPEAGYDAITTMTATDAVKILSGHDPAEGGSVGAGETTGARIDRILDNAGWPETDRHLETGETTVQATTLGQNTWAEMLLTADTEPGDLYVTGDGKVAFRNRWAPFNTVRSRTSKATFGDGADELPFANVVLGYDDVQIRNQVDITRVGGSVQSAGDATSQARYGIRNYNRTDLIMQDDATALSYATFVLYVLKEPTVRIESIEIRPHADPDMLFPQVLGRELGDRVTVAFTPPGEGDRISQDVFIRGIEHRVTPDDWVTVFTFQDATRFSESVMVFDLGEFDTNTFGY